MISYIMTKGRSSFTTCEDSLTSGTLDYLKYLPINLFWRILRKSMYHNKLPKYSGELIQMEYWPKWSSKDTSNSHFIEPDVFLRFEEFDILIEAKRQNRIGQTSKQLENEVQGYLNEYGKEQKTLYFVKLGGLNTTDDEIYKNPNIIICKTDWSKLLNEICTLKNELERSNGYLANHYIRLLDDCIKGFSIHQYYAFEWLVNLKKRRINTLSIPLQIEIK